MNTDVTRVAKAIAAVVVLTIIVIVVWGWWGDYRSAQPGESQEPTSTATSTVESTKTSGGETATTPAKTTTVVVLIEGLNMREEPAADGARIRGLKKGDKLVLIKTQDSWYQVRAADKKVGWISANPQYTKLEE